MLFSWKKLAEQRGGRMGDIIDCLNCFHYTSAKSMTFFFPHNILYPFHIRLLHNILYPHSTELPASVLQTSTYDIYYKWLLFIIPHIVSEGFMSSAAVFMLRKYNFSCSIFSFVCVIINKSTVELHVQWPVFLVIWYEDVWSKSRDVHSICKSNIFKLI